MRAGARRTGLPGGVSESSRATFLPERRTLRSMDALECLEKYGQRLDYEIAEETGIALAEVREQLAALTGTGRVITCKLTQFDRGGPTDSLLYRASGYFPRPAPGRKPKSGS